MRARAVSWDSLLALTHAPHHRPNARTFPIVARAGGLLGEPPCADPCPASSAKRARKALSGSTAIPLRGGRRREASAGNLLNPLQNVCGCAQLRQCSAAASRHQHQRYPAIPRDTPRYPAIPPEIQKRYPEVGQAAEGPKKSGRGMDGQRGRASITKHTFGLMQKSLAAPPARAVGASSGGRPTGVAQ